MEHALLSRKTRDRRLQSFPFPRIVTPVPSRLMGASPQQHGRRSLEQRPVRVPRRARRAFTLLVALTGAALVAFHIALFAVQAGAGRLVEPALAVKWGVSVLLCVALLGLKRSGVPLLWGRRALAVWLLAGLLHWNTAPAPDAGQPILPQIIVELQSSAGLVLLGTGLLLTLFGQRRSHLILARGRLARSVRVIHPDSALLSRYLASRAPPACCLA